MSAARAGDFDYDTHGHGYATVRRPDPCIAAHVHNALGDARTVLNVGTGAGSYQPADRYIAAVETSAAMRAQRPATPFRPSSRATPRRPWPGRRARLRRRRPRPALAVPLRPAAHRHRTPPPPPAGPGGPVSLGFVDDADEAPASPGSPPTWNPGCGRMALGRRARRTHPGRYHRRLEPALASGAAGVGRIDEVRGDADAAEHP